MNEFYKKRSFAASLFAFVFGFLYLCATEMGNGEWENGRGRLSASFVLMAGDG